MPDCDNDISNSSSISLFRSKSLAFGVGLVIYVPLARDPPLPQVCARGSAFQDIAVVQLALADGLRFGL